MQSVKFNHWVKTQNKAVAMNKDTQRDSVKAIKHRVYTQIDKTTHFC